MRREDIQKLIDDGVGLILATCDAQLCPDVADAEALEVDFALKTLKVYLLAKKCVTALRNIQSHPQIAVTIVRPTDNAAVQFKGQVEMVRAITESEGQRAKELSDRYRKEIVLVGMAPEITAALDMSVDSVLEISVAEIFHQTPGSKAGQILV